MGHSCGCGHDHDHEPASTCEDAASTRGGEEAHECGCGHNHEHAPVISPEDQKKPEEEMAKDGL